MRIAIINLDSPFLLNAKVFPPLGILYIASALRKAGHEPVWYDFAGDGVCRIVNEDIVFITITSPQIPDAISYVKKFCIGKKVVIGGCGVSSLTREQKKLFNVIISGEADDSIEDILSLLSCAPPVSLNVGIVDDLDKIEFPARDLIEGYSYKINGRNATTMMTSRGCPHNCIFCLSGKSKRVRLASVESVYKEIDEIAALNFSSIMFFDDIFTMKKRRLKAITDYLKSKNVLYRCFSHINSVNSELCAILADSGCVEVGIGIESGSNFILETIKKGFTREKSINAVNMLNDYGIRVKAFLMLGLPGESHNTIEETKSWLKKAKPTNFDISLFSPFPNTELYDNRYEYNINFNGDTPKFFKGIKGKYKTSVSTSFIDKEELVKQRDLIEKMYKK